MNNFFAPMNGVPAGDPCLKLWLIPVRRIALTFQCCCHDLDQLFVVDRIFYQALIEFENIKIYANA